MLLPRKELSIPVDHIIGIEDPVSFLGKSRSKPLLKVYFNTEKGTDSAAWLLENVNQWKSLLEELIDKPADQLLAFHNRFPIDIISALDYIILPAIIPHGSPRLT